MEQCPRELRKEAISNLPWVLHIKSRSFLLPIPSTHAPLPPQLVSFSSVLKIFLARPT